MTKPDGLHKAVAVYCASSSRANPVYTEAAREVGRLLAEAGIRVICGAGNQGLMEAVSDAVLAAGGRVTGVIPRFMREEGWMHPGLSEYIVTETMHERKAVMTDRADGVIALPGGCGTLEELLETITWKQLGLFRGAVVILNTNGYYDALIAMLQRAVSESLMREEHAALWQVASSPREALQMLLEAEPAPADIRKRAAI